jgi:hypothetical protein
MSRRSITNKPYFKKAKTLIKKNKLDLRNLFYGKSSVRKNTGDELEDEDIENVEEAVETEQAVEEETERENKVKGTTYNAMPTSYFTSSNSSNVYHKAANPYFASNSTPVDTKKQTLAEKWNSNITDYDDMYEYKEVEDDIKNYEEYLRSGDTRSYEDYLSSKHGPVKTRTEEEIDTDVFDGETDFDEEEIDD